MLTRSQNSNPNSPLVPGVQAETITPTPETTKNSSENTCNPTYLPKTEIHQEESTRPRIKLRPPTPFNGTTSEYHEFIFNMENEFDSNPQFYPNDQAMIAYCSSYLTGPALKHFRTQSQANPLIKTYWTLFTEVLALFQPYNEDDQALSVLKGLRQVASVRESVDNFLPLATPLLTTYPVNYIIGLFTGGLSLKISDALLAFPESNLLVTVCQRAISIDDRMKSNRAERTRRFPVTQAPQRPTFQRPQIYQPQYAQTSPPQASISGPTGPPLPSMARRVAGPLTAEERAHRVANNLCIICASNSHHRNECPRNRNRQQLNALNTQETTKTP